jgi:hypothetical protein
MFSSLHIIVSYPNYSIVDIPELSCPPLHTLSLSLDISFTPYFSLAFTLSILRWESNSGTPFRPEVSVSKSSTNDVVSTSRVIESYCTSLIRSNESLDVLGILFFTYCDLSDHLTLITV